MARIVGVGHSKKTVYLVVKDGQKSVTVNMSISVALEVLVGLGMEINKAREEK